MNKRSILASALILTITFAVAIAQGVNSIKELLSGYEEVPTLSTSGKGEFKAKISPDGTAIEYELSYSELEGNVLQAHIHLGARGINGGISVWLCGNQNTTPPVNPPAGTPACPPAPATVSGVLTFANVVGPATQGIDPNEASKFEELISAIRAGATYVNVHTTKYPGGEIRSQIDHSHGNQHGTQK